MFRTLIASALLFGALVLPAAADDFDFRVVGGTGYGYQAAGQERWGGGPAPRGGWHGGGAGPARGWQMPPWQIARSLRYQGFRDVEILRQRPDVTIARASARGRDVILVVDSRSGEVLRRQPADNWRQGRGWHGGWGQDWRRW